MELGAVAWRSMGTIYWVGRPLVPKVLFTVFREFPRLLGFTAAAMLPKQARGSFRKHITKPSEQVAAVAPPSKKLILAHIVAISPSFLLGLAPLKSKYYNLLQNQVG